MMQAYTHEQFTDDQGRPAGGVAESQGIHIEWQNGPLGTGEARVAPNGAFVETVIRIAADRLEHYQDSQFACIENAIALGNLQAALTALDNRTKRRIALGVEGTHEGH